MLLACSHVALYRSLPLCIVLRMALAMSASPNQSCLRCQELSLALLHVNVTFLSLCAHLVRVCSIILVFLCSIINILVYLPRTAKYSTSSDRSNAVTVASDNALQPLDMGKMQVLDARQDGTKFVEIKWPNGDMYVGEMSADGQLKGHGAYWYHTNAQYVGAWHA